MSTPKPKKRTPGAVDNSARAEAAKEAANAEPDVQVKRIPGERVPSKPIAEPLDRVLALLSGQEATDSETVQYFIDKARSLAEEGVALGAQSQQMEKDLMQVQHRIASVKIEIESSKRDIANWIKRPGATPPELKPVE